MESRSHGFPPRRGSQRGEHLRLELFAQAHRARALHVGVRRARQLNDHLAQRVEARGAQRGGGRGGQAVPKIHGSGGSESQPVPPFACGHGVQGSGFRVQGSGVGV